MRLAAVQCIKSYAKRYPERSESNMVMLVPVLQEVGDSRVEEGMLLLYS